MMTEEGRFKMEGGDKESVPIAIGIEHPTSDIKNRTPINTQKSR